LLSYRHSFHAGNFADVIKHIVLVEIIEHLKKKEAPFEYIDTHAGAGLFSLHSEHAVKLEEHNDGICKIKLDNFPELSRYFNAVYAHNTTEKIEAYPGSPAIAKYLLRPQDRAWLFELHPEDYTRLCHNMGESKKVRVSCEDGLKGLLKHIPPTSRRSVVLIDPSYEIKSEYDQVFDVLSAAHKKFPSGTYALWYPVVERERITRLENKFSRSGLRNIQRFELGISADSNERGMTSSGMFVINPPWTLFQTMQGLLPKLAKILTTDNVSYFKCDTITDE